MAAILLEVKKGDEVIAPSFTFVSAVNAFVLRGAKIVFTDSDTENPNINMKSIEQLRSHNIHTVFHYQSLHKSAFYKNKLDGRDLPRSYYYSENLLRLPLHFELQDSQVDFFLIR